ncbi:MAG: hypothetical protein NC218_03390 [Acetobacter sp.]|nr:hypothetical protein [Acetobacter sp.]
MKKSDLNNKDKFLLELTEVFTNEEYLFDILGAEATLFEVGRTAKGASVMVISLANNKKYNLTLTEVKNG